MNENIQILRKYQCFSVNMEMQRSQSIMDVCPWLSNQDCVHFVKSNKKEMEMIS